MTITKSPCAAASTLFIITSQGTSKSLMLSTAKSVINGEPTSAAQELSEDTPGTTSTYSPLSLSQPDSARISYIPGSPLDTSDTILPDLASSMHWCARSTSCVIAYL